MADAAPLPPERMGVDEGAAGPSTSRRDKPICVIVIGMAGSGKTTLMQRINSHVHERTLASYMINLDPAVTHVPFGVNVDIRDTVNYKNVMKEYNLGPNGAILTSLNLFATRFDQVMTLLTKERSPPLKYVFADTPGQIEIFTWSASGSIVTEALATEFPTVVLFVVDTPRCAAPQTFMSNMLQACSILYKTRLPLVVAFNKVDAARHEPCVAWMQDYEDFHAALDEDPSYASTLSRSLSLALEDFYSGLAHVGVSALTGEGMDDLFAAFQKAADEYWAEYVPDQERRRRDKAEAERRRVEAQVEKLRADIQQAKLQGVPITVHRAGNT